MPLFVIGGMGRDGGTDTAATTTATTQAPPAEQRPSDGGGQAPAAPEGDRSTPVLVINAGGENGMAGKWRTALADKGWTAVDIQTAQSRQEQAVVFYRAEEDAASAQPLAQEAGVGEAQQSDEYDARITFVAVRPRSETRGPGMLPAPPVRHRAVRGRPAPCAMFALSVLRTPDRWHSPRSSAYDDLALSGWE